MALFDHNNSTSSKFNGDSQQQRQLFCGLSGSCTCNSFSNALHFIRSNTVINITSPVVSMDTRVFIQRVSNITITSKNGTTVTCSSVGSLQFIGCSNVTIEAITWDHCGNMNLLTLEGIGFTIQFQTFP